MNWDLEPGFPYPRPVMAGDAEKRLTQGPHCDRCAAPMFAVLAAQGCTNPQDLVMACCLGWCFT